MDRSELLIKYGFIKKDKKEDNYFYNEETGEYEPVEGYKLNKKDADEEHTEVIPGQYDTTGFPAPKKTYRLSWEVYDLSLEEPYFWVLDYLKQSLERKEQAILFLPTRANFKYLICTDCGHTHKCIFCSVGMSIHQKTRSLKCHYCNFAQAIPQKCVECGSPNLTSSRLGTAEAVKNIREEFESARVEQFDRDAITTANKLRAALKSFNERETDILVGTQR